MALIKPFINSIRAFNANVGTEIPINVLGGERIAGFRVFIYYEDDSSAPFFTSNDIPVSGDVGGESIRTFDFFLSNGLVGTDAEGQLATLRLNNNKNYLIQAQTYNSSNENSGFGNLAYFSCYITPQVSINYFNGSEYAPLSNDTRVSSYKVGLQVYFDAVDILSGAQPNVANITLLGLTNGNYEQIFNTGDLFTFTKDTESGSGIDKYSCNFDVAGFYVNVDYGGLPKADAKYSSYKIVYRLTTIDNMEVSGEIVGITSYYATLRNSPLLTLNNMCCKGIVEINCSLSSFGGQTNQEPQKYVTNDDLVGIDLTDSNDWVLWQNYFSLSQPYTLNLWGWGFNEGVIAEMMPNTNPSKYIQLRYEKEIVDDETQVFISLECGQNNALGQKMFPYYIESERIAESEITSTTQLFIGIQQNDRNGLFNIDFEKVEDEEE